MDDVCHSFSKAIAMIIRSGSQRSTWELIQMITATTEWDGSPMCAKPSHGSQDWTLPGSVQGAAGGSLRETQPSTWSQEHKMRTVKAQSAANELQKNAAPF